MYSTGSDDFRAYAWRLPDVLQMQEMRQEIPSNDWPHGPDGEIGALVPTSTAGLNADTLQASQHRLAARMSSQCCLMSLLFA